MGVIKHQPGTIGMVKGGTRAMPMPFLGDRTKEPRLELVKRLAREWHQRGGPVKWTLGWDDNLGCWVLLDTDGITFGGSC